MKLPHLAQQYNKENKMAWTITETWTAYPINRVMGEELIVIKLDCTSDANGTDYDIVAIDKIRGGTLYEMKVIPGSGDDEPSAAWDIDLEDYNDDHILDTDDNAVDATTFHDGSITIGHYPIIEDKLSFVSATLGDGNTCVVYIKVWK
jgi:hypothetical protein